MKKIKALMIGAGSRGTFAYGPYALNYPDQIEFVGVAEPDPVRRERFCSLHTKAQNNAVNDWKELFKKKPEADVVFICTQDQ